MSTEEQKPTETPVAPAPEVAAAEPTVADSVDKPEEAKPTDTIEAVKPAEGAEKTVEAKEEKKDLKATEPITSGILEYKAPGLIKSIIFSKKYFFLGEEAISSQNLSRYLRGEKPEVSHPAAAWSSQTGKGLLYFSKHADQKANPIGVLKLSDASDLARDGLVEITVKLGGHKHAFQANSAKERDGWFIALEKAIEEAKASQEEIVGSEGYKETITQLGKPSALATATASKSDSTPKKSTDTKPTEGAAIERASSSSSSDAEKKKTKEKKSRSVSRGKRASIFSSLLSKKEEVKDKADEKKEEAKDKVEENKAEKKDESKKDEEVKAEPTAAEASTTSPVAEAATGSETKPEETKKEEAKEEAKPEEQKTDTAKTPKVKRGSIFGAFFEKVKSPTTEKKEAEVAPVPPPKEEPEAEASAAAATAEQPAEAKPDGSNEATVVPAAAEEAKKEDVKEEAKEAPKTETTPGATPDTKEKRRASFFSGFSKKEKKPAAESEGETTEGEKKSPVPKLGSLFRNPSKAVKGNKEAKKEPPTPKVEEETPAETKEKTEAPAATTTTEAEATKEEQPKPAIGDVVPEAVTVGSAPSSSPAVQATA